MTIHSLAHALPIWHDEGAAKPHAGLAVPPRLVSTRAELRVYLRHRRRAWRSSLLALALGAASVACWAYTLSQLG
ncbi:MAG TPA: hypothetical protein VLA96_14310 [Terriglobales bacterium]|nr:hypothetical protein [Terriglobales bacterium]